MEITQTKAITLLLAFFTLLKMVHDVLTMGTFDYSMLLASDLIPEAIVIIISIYVAHKHHDEVKVALYTPVPENETGQ